MEEFMHEEGIMKGRADAWRGRYEKKDLCMKGRADARGGQLV